MIIVYDLFGSFHLFLFSRLTPFLKQCPNQMLQFRDLLNKKSTRERPLRMEELQASGTLLLILVHLLPLLSPTLFFFCIIFFCQQPSRFSISFFNRCDEQQRLFCAIIQVVQKEPMETLHATDITSTGYQTCYCF